jgi:hypothetical protein
VRLRKSDGKIKKKHRKERIKHQGRSRKVRWDAWTICALQYILSEFQAHPSELILGFGSKIVLDAQHARRRCKKFLYEYYLWVVLTKERSVRIAFGGAKETWVN